MYQHLSSPTLSYLHATEETKTLDQAKTDFIKYQTARDLSPKTISWHDHCIGDFVQYAHASAVHRTHELTDDVIIDWLMQLRSRKVRGKAYSARTISWYTRSLHTWFTWLYKRGLVSGDVTGTAKVKEQSAKIEILSLEEINEILQACSDVSPDNKQMIRNIAIITVLYDTGIRLSELCGLQLQDINHQNKTIRVRGKGCKDRTLSLGDIAYAMLKQYLHICSDYPLSVAANHYCLLVREPSITSFTQWRYNP